MQPRCSCRNPVGARCRLRFARFEENDVGVVGVAADARGYNHKILIPRMMEGSAADPTAETEFRRTVPGEAAAMLRIVVLTALLVGAAS